MPGLIMDPVLNNINSYPNPYPYPQDIPYIYPKTLTIL